jgi:hypothetical protein
VIPAAAGKHRRPEDEPPQVPAQMALDSAEFFRPPPDAVGPVDAWGPMRYGTPGPQAAAGAGPPRLPVRRPGSGPYPGGAAPRAPDDPPAAGYGPGRGYDRGQSLLTRGDRPEHGQRWLYAVPNDAPAAGPADRRPGRPPTAPFADRQAAGPSGRGGDLRDGDAGHVAAGQVVTADDQAAAIKDEAWDQAAAIRRAAEREAATIRRQAESRAAEIRQTAEREAAELRSAILAMSGELGRAAAYVAENLATPASGPPVLPGEPAAATPGGPATGPAGPPARAQRSAATS